MSTAAAVTERSTSAPSRQLTPLQEVRGQLDSMEPQFKLALPGHIPAERFARVVMTAVSANPDLITKCTRVSLFAAAMKSAQDGLLPDGREAALIPFKGVVQYLPMVGGILKKVRNSGQLSTIVARVVYAGDKFRNWIDDEGEHIEYEAGDDQDRSVVRRVFAMAKLKDGSIEVEVLQPADIEKIRNVSRAKDNGPWVSWWDQMAQKSAIRRLAKRLPISTDLDDLIRRDDALYDFQGAREEAVAANGGRAQSLVGKFDALTKMPSRADAPSVEESVDAPHDPATGEVKDGAQQQPDQGDEAEGGDAGGADGAGVGTGRPASASDGSQQQPPAEDSRRNVLMHRLRAKAEAGTKALNRALGGLMPVDNEALTQADRTYLTGLAEEVDRERAGA